MQGAVMSIQMLSARVIMFLTSRGEGGFNYLCRLNMEKSYEMQTHNHISSKWIQQDEGKTVRLLFTKATS